MQDKDEVMKLIYLRKLIAFKYRCNANSFKCQFLPDYCENVFMLAYSGCSGKELHLISTS